MKQRDPLVIKIILAFAIIMDIVGIAVSVKIGDFLLLICFALLLPIVLYVGTVKIRQGRSEKGKSA